MRKRDKQIIVRLTEAETAKLKNLLHLLKIGQSAYIRHCIGQTHEKLKIPPSRDYKGLYTEINRIGRNINQIAKKCNEGEETLSVKEPLLFYMAELYKLLDKHL